MHHLRMELHAIKAPPVISNRRLRSVLRVGKPHKSLGQRLHRIAMAHPHRRALLDIGEQVDRIVHRDRRLAVFGPTGSHHGATQLLHHQLHAVANAQHRNAQVPDGGIADRRTLFVNRTGATAEDESFRRQLA